MNTELVNSLIFLVFGLLGMLKIHYWDSLSSVVRNSVPFLKQVIYTLSMVRKWKKVFSSPSIRQEEEKPCSRSEVYQLLYHLRQMTLERPL